MRALLPLLLLLAAPAGAVGLGPLHKEGIVDGPKKGFYLTLLNPYDQAVDYIAYAVDAEDETPNARVLILPAETRLGAHQNRRLLVIAKGLSVGETFVFRVCAQRKQPPEGIAINARVCSKLTARRVA